ncbi:MAG: type II/IV secretion system ATPase subunit [Nanoarchaeota archaeon]|nr:type II/IV secretion system ATPase subunit [Nanoarchaeota archaeon]
MAGIKNLGKRLRKAKMDRELRTAPETLVVPRFTTLPMGPRQPGQTPFIPYSQTGAGQKEVYIVESDVVKPEQKPGGGKTEVNVNIEAGKGGGGGEGEMSIEEEIAKKIKESPFKLRFKTLNIQELQKAGAAAAGAPRPGERDIRKTFTGAYAGTERGEETINLLRKVNRVVPLITLTQGMEKKVVSYATIKWNEETQELIYAVHEPQMNDEEMALLDEIKGILKEKLNVDFEKIRGSQAYNYIITEFNKILKKIGIKLTDEQQLKFNYFVYRDFIGLEQLEPLMHDPNIEDISCVGYGIPIFIYHRDPLFNQIATNVMFKSKNGLDSFVLKLAQKCGKSLTLAEPLMDGALPDGSRVQATYGTREIARRGSNFTIRKFTHRPMTPVDLINLQTIDSDTLAYVWFVVEHNMSIMVAGATATGKTTFLNAISLFIKPEFKIISIEDTAELRLPHPNWIAAVARHGFGGKTYGEITMYDLLKAGLRQRPDYIIVGEVRGEEATVMFQGMATGHPALGTIHADSMPAVVDRLTNKPIDLPRTILENLDVVIFLEKFKVGGRFIRKVKEIVEIVGYDYKNKEIVTNSSFRWDPADNKFLSFDSVILDRIQHKGGYTMEELRIDMNRRIKLLNYLVDKKVTDYRTFSTFISKYYHNPSFVETL